MYPEKLNYNLNKDLKTFDQFWEYEGIGLLKINNIEYKLEQCLYNASAGINVVQS